MKSIAITSGKGGVGKTTVAANLAAALGHSGNVLALDADLGLANLDILLGVRPAKTLNHVVRDGLALSDAVTPAPGGIGLIAGGSGIEELARLGDEQLQPILSQLQELAEGYDWLMVDTAAGLSPHVLCFASSVDQAVIVCTPDPASIMDAYATAKSLFARNPSNSPLLVVNCADSEEQAEVVYGKLRTIVGRFLNRSLGYAGCVRRDPVAAACARTRELYVLKNPKCAASRDVLRLAQKLSQSPAEDSGLSLLQRLREAFLGGKPKAA